MGRKLLRKSSFARRRTSLQVNLSYVKNISNDSYMNRISGQEEELNKSCDRLKEAILLKTREIFDKQNDFCLRTATILDQPSSSSSNSSGTKSSQELKKLKSQENREVNENDPGNRLNYEDTGKSIIRTFNDSPIISSSNFRCNGTILLPTKKSSQEQLILEPPLKCSSFKNEFCNTPTRSQPIVELRKLYEKEENQTPPRLSRPSIKKIRSCYISLDRIDGFSKKNISKDLKQVSMDLTPVQGNNILNKKSEIQKTRGKTIEKKNYEEQTDSCESSENHEINSSMEVRTSVNPISNNSTSTCPTFNTKKSSSTKLSMKVNTSLEPQDENSFEVVEGTPRTETRSILLRSQSRLNFSKSFVNVESSDSEKLLNTPTTTKNVATERKSRLSDTILLDYTQASTSRTSHVIIEESSDSSDDEEASILPEKNANEMADINISTQVKKRRLFSLLNTSDLTNLSPATNVATPKINRPSPKKVRRKKLRRNLAGKLVGSSQAIMMSTQKTTQRNKQQQDEDNQPTTRKRKKPDPKLEKKTKKRNFVSKKIIVKKAPVNLELTKILEESGIRSQSSSSGNHSCENSSEDFMEKKQIVTKGRNYHGKKIFIVATGLTNGDKDLVKNAVKKINGAKYENSVTRNTTHVVTTGVRTINLLRGIIRGCWLVNLRWIKKSIEAKRWLSTEAFEMDQFSKAVLENRTDRELFGRHYVPELFTTSGLIYIDTRTNPPKEILKELVKLAGGRVIEDPKKAKIIVGPNGLREIWILDSITTGELQSTDQYQR